MRISLLVCASISIFFFSECTSKKATPAVEDAGPHLFTQLLAESTHVYFNNALTEGLNTNVLMYEYFYNGAGVATADLNGDGFDDLYFSGSMTPNKLYLNKGN